ncbi:MAG: M48 family metalloprotease, partial [Holosporaceae bacterium]|nr:M48 family metalloprotease [Holosporaceae bacterium]
MKLLRILLASFFLLAKGSAEADLCLVRDAEIEETLTEMAKPIFKIAGLRPKSAKIYVVNSEIPNAFTTGNGCIFINSGLLLQFKNPLHLLGILCHETGHIAAGHIYRHMSVLEQRSKNFMLAMTAGILGTMAAGSDGAMALCLGYLMTDERLYLRFSRGEEFAADALAAAYLEKLGYGPDVLVDAFDMFQRMDVLNGEENLAVYIKTHPKTSDRISALRRRGEFKKHSQANQELLNK